MYSFANNSLTCVLLTFGSSRMNINITASQNFESDKWDPKVSPLICISQWHCYGQAFFPDRCFPESKILIF